MTQSSTFPRFAELPPEIRHQIYLAAIPKPGINFFNVHIFPNDHKGCNRSTSPPHLHLDLRRIAIKDDDDTVTEYDPSVWQARSAMRKTCREARIACAILPGKGLNLTMTRPKRGLFVRAGDGLLRSMTPEYENPRKEAERLVFRTIQVHTDEMVALSVENCSLNINVEEEATLHSNGWAYDPEFDHPSVCLEIAENRFCLNFATQFAVSGIDDGWPELLKAVTGRDDGVPDGQWKRGPEYCVMVDQLTHYDGIKEPHDGNIWWDRWGDFYGSFNCGREDFGTESMLMKVLPEKSDVRVRYMRSALLPSPKRPARTELALSSLQEML